MFDTSKRKSPKPQPVPRPWRRALQRLDEALEKNSRCDNSEKIEIFGRLHFGDLWNYRNSDQNQDQPKN